MSVQVEPGPRHQAQSELEMALRLERHSSAPQMTVTSFSGSKAPRP